LILGTAKLEISNEDMLSKSSKMKLNVLLWPSICHGSMSILCLLYTAFNPQFVWNLSKNVMHFLIVCFLIFPEGAS